MKIALFVLTSLLFIGCSSTASKNEKKNYAKYDEFTWNAMLHYDNEEYGKSLADFQEAFEVIPDENVSDYFYAAASALHQDKPQVAKQLIIQSIEQTKTDKDYFKEFDEFNAFRDNAIFAEIEQNYDTHIANFYKNLDHPDIYREVDSLVDVDQKYRQDSIDWAVTNKHDSLNIKRLMEITKKYGWYPKGWLVLWHQRGTYGQDNAVWSFFQPYLKKQIAEGRIRKKILAHYAEEKSIIEKKEQIYGMYWSQFDEYPLTQLKNVDQRRADIGLPPFWFMHKIYATPVPNGYDKKAQNSISLTNRKG